MIIDFELFRFVCIVGGFVCIYEIGIVVGCWVLVGLLECELVG